jgi:hypothetical protein
MTRINVPLPGEALSALADLSAREWRDPRDQAAVIIIEGLRRRGLITEDRTGDDPNTQAAGSRAAVVEV